MPLVRGIRAAGHGYEGDALVLRELFAGTGRITHEWQRAAPALEPIEVYEDPHRRQGYRGDHDLLQPAIQQKILQEIREGPSNVFWLAAPCTSFCDWQQQNGGSRSFQLPLGTGSGPLAKTEAAGNSLSDFAAVAFETALDAGAFPVAESSAASGRYPKQWDLPSWRRVLARPDVDWLEFPMCAFELGPPDEPHHFYVHRTRVVFPKHAPLRRALQRRCPGVSTKHRHVALKGSRDGQQVSRCTEAGAYAPNFVAVVAVLQSSLGGGMVVPQIHAGGLSQALEEALHPEHRDGEEGALHPEGRDGDAGALHPEGRDGDAGALHPEEGNGDGGALQPGECDGDEGVLHPEDRGGEGAPCPGGVLHLGNHGGEGAPCPGGEGPREDSAGASSGARSRSPRLGRPRSWRTSQGQTEDGEESQTLTGVWSTPLSPPAEGPCTRGPDGGACGMCEWCNPQVPAQQGDDRDWWQLREGHVIVHHVLPRTLLFTPDDNIGSVIHPSRFRNERLTAIHHGQAGGRYGASVITDNWRDAGGRDPGFGEWTGTTTLVFQGRSLPWLEEEEDNSPSGTSTGGHGVSEGSEGELGSEESTRRGGHPETQGQARPTPEHDDRGGVRERSGDPQDELGEVHDHSGDLRGEPGEVRDRPGELQGEPNVEAGPTTTSERNDSQEHQEDEVVGGSGEAVWFRAHSGARRPTDGWGFSIASGQLWREHNVPRTTLYAFCDLGLPAPLDRLASRRRTHLRMEDGTTVVLEDDWRGAEEEDPGFGPWTGLTTFYLQAGEHPGEARGEASEDGTEDEAGDDPESEEEEGVPRVIAPACPPETRVKAGSRTYTAPSPEAKAAAVEYTRVIEEEFGNTAKGWRAAVMAGSALVKAAGGVMAAASSLWEVREEKDLMNLKGIEAKEFDEILHPDHLAYLRDVRTRGMAARYTGLRSRSSARLHPNARRHVDQVYIQVAKDTAKHRVLVVKSDLPELWGTMSSPFEAVDKMNPDRTISQDKRVVHDQRAINTGTTKFLHPPALQPSHAQVAKRVLWMKRRFPGVPVLLAKKDIAGAVRLLWVDPADAELFAGDLPWVPHRAFPLEDVGQEGSLGSDVTVIYLVSSFGFSGSPGEWCVWGRASEEYHRAHRPAVPRRDLSLGFDAKVLVDDCVLIEPWIGYRPWISSEVFEEGVTKMLGPKAVNAEKDLIEHAYKASQTIWGVIMDTEEEKAFLPEKRIQKGAVLLSGAEFDFRATHLTLKQLQQFRGILTGWASVVQGLANELKAADKFLGGLDGNKPVRPKLKGERF